MPWKHRRRNDFQSGGGGKFLEVKNGASAPAVALARRRVVSEGGCGPLRSWSFFENVDSNEVIWCTIFHHVKRLTACLLRCFFFNFRKGWSKKWRGHAPQSEKWRGHWPLWPPGSAAYAWMYWRGLGLDFWYTSTYSWHISIVLTCSASFINLD